MSCCPVLAGCAAIQQRETDLARAQEPLALMVDAARAAGADSGAPGLLAAVERIYVPRGMWSYSDPGRLVARAIGAPAAVTVLAEIGILQQSLLGDACARIARGEIQCALVLGGEAKFRQLQASIQQQPAPETPQQDPPDEVMQPEQELWLAAESRAGLGMPVGYYAIIESALRAARGESLDAHRDRLAQLYQRFSEIAAQNPQAWKRDVVPAAAIRAATGKNRMLAFPYTRAHNSEWNVDQAAALLLCSTALADAWGIPAAQRVYPLASTESNHMLCVAQRASLHRVPGTAIALQAGLAHLGRSAGSFGLLDLYSCFPAAVQVFADALAVAPDRDLTVTGGMAAAGGPLNNYVLQATVRMAQLLRQQAESDAAGIVSSVSGMLTKQAYGFWGKCPPTAPFVWLDVSAAVADAAPPVAVLDDYTGPATIAGYTVLYQGDAPSRAIVVADTPDGQRVVAFSEDSALMHAMMAEEYVGRVVAVADGQCSEKSAQ